jgi:hypothetical protein
MNAQPLTCSQCRGLLLEPTLFNTQTLVNCPGCGALLALRLFPAFFKEAPISSAGEPILIEGQSACFYHPDKKAVLPCDGCGRFLCALCELDMNGRHICPVCLERGVEKGKLVELETGRTRYDQLAFWLALIPILFWPLTLLTAPGAIYLSIRHWNSPTHYIHPSRTKLILALLLASLQVAGWGVLFYLLLLR